MTNDIKHKQLSWDCDETSGGQVVTLYDNNDKRIVELPAAQEPLIAHIVKCVNAHDALVEAVADILDNAMSEPCDQYRVYFNQEEMRKLKEAYKLAKGE